MQEEQLYSIIKRHTQDVNDDNIFQLFRDCINEVDDENKTPVIIKYFSALFAVLVYTELPSQEVPIFESLLYEYISFRKIIKQPLDRKISISIDNLIDYYDMIKHQSITVFFRMDNSPIIPDIFPVYYAIEHITLDFCCDNIKRFMPIIIKLFGALPKCKTIDISHHLNKTQISYYLILNYKILVVMPLLREISWINLVITESDHNRSTKLVIKNCQIDMPNNNDGSPVLFDDENIHVISDKRTLILNLNENGVWFFRCILSGAFIITEPPIECPQNYQIIVIDILSMLFTTNKYAKNITLEIDRKIITEVVLRFDGNRDKSDGNIISIISNIEPKSLIKCLIIVNYNYLIDKLTIPDNVIIKNILFIDMIVRDGIDDIFISSLKRCCDIQYNNDLTGWFKSMGFKERDDIE